MFTDKIQEALENSKRELERQHLTMLNASKAKSLALIFDTHFYGYERNIVKWDVEEAVLSDPVAALNNYKLQSKDSWLWHLAPQGIEYQEYGLIHQVEGYVFSK